MKEQELLLMQVSDERKSLAEERRVFTEMQKKIQENGTLLTSSFYMIDENIIRRVHEKEMQLDIERQRISQERYCLLPGMMITI